MSDTITHFQPGTNAYAGARLDARNAALTSVGERLGRGRGESTALVNLAKAASKAIGFYDLHPAEAQCEAAEQIEIVFGTLIARLNALADSNA